ncbi:hypothetical protein FRC10_006492 [Ceratobasidium sp. 414]|nr:hypothetical protein FRC10_006492 [Ceratobasidium sp. 414]
MDTVNAGVPAQPPAPGAPLGAAPSTRILPQIHTVFHVGDKPDGTPGKKRFCIRSALGLDSVEYLGFLNAVWDIANRLHFDWLKPWRHRNAAIVSRIYNKTLEIYPNLHEFERANVDNPQWPVECCLQVTKKSGANMRRNLMHH